MKVKRLSVIAGLKSLRIPKAPVKVVLGLGSKLREVKWEWDCNLVRRNLISFIVASLEKDHFKGWPVRLAQVSIQLTGKYWLWRQMCQSVPASKHLSHRIIFSASDSVILKQPSDNFLLPINLLEEKEWAGEARTTPIPPFQSQLYWCLWRCVTMNPSSRVEFMRPGIQEEGNFLRKMAISWDHALKER